MQVLRYSFGHIRQLSSLFRPPHRAHHQVNMVKTIIYPITIIQVIYLKYPSVRQDPEFGVPFCREVHLIRGL
jgi:hypothetical protein